MNLNSKSAFLSSTVLVSAVFLVPSQVQALTLYTGVEAGDATQNSAIIWTRTTDANQAGTVSNLTAQISTDPNFTSIATTLPGTTVASRDYTLKLDATGLNSGTQYYYRFQNQADNTFSQVGTFKTAPQSNAQVPVHFGFSGDDDGKWRPYPSTLGFSNNKLDYYVNLADTIYETASTGSPATISLNNPTAANIAQAVTDYQRKYRENIQPAPGGTFPSLQGLYASQGNYTLLDNHELGNNQLINGGAPAANALGLGVDATNTANDVNSTGKFINKTDAFKALVGVYSEYQPIRETTIVAPNDPRTDGTQKMYYSQQWGANSVFINLDDRSYRDIRLKLADGTTDDTQSARGDNPNRTMLGKTQLDWLKQTLLDAKTNNTAWKIIALSSPIDEIGLAAPISGDGGKSWIGGYRAERNDLLKFIADNNIQNVVFLSTDDHQNRINELTYISDLANPLTSPRVVVPGVFTIVAGPIGAGGPDAITDHSFSNIKTLADTLAAKQSAAGVNPVGLSPNYPGLTNVTRDGDPNANTLRQPVDFYSPDTFNYALLDISADGKALTVNTYGINSYAANTFPEPSTANPVRNILSFQVQAKAATAVPEPLTIVGALTALGLGGIFKRKLGQNKTKQK